MSTQIPHDIPLLITVPSDPSTSNSTPVISIERRITPIWTISTLKSKLEPITGIPWSSQSLRVKSLTTNSWIYLTDSNSLVGSREYGLTKGSEIEILDSRPAGSRLRFDDVSSVEKYVMPADQYSKLDDSVLAWKRKQKLGRFDPNAKSQEELARERREKDSSEVARRGVEVGRRCRVGGEDVRRGVVRYVGEIEGLGGEREAGCVWVGVEFDEPVGRNDGSVEIEVVEEGGAEGSGKAGKKRKESRRVFKARGDKHGTFVRPERVEIGEFPVLDDLMDEDMEEI